MNPFPKVIIASGGMRTGSTLAFNVAREILAATGAGGAHLSLGASAADAEALCCLPPCFIRDTVLVKAHWFYPPLSGADLSHVAVIHTMRGSGQAAASLARMGQRAEDIPVMAERNARVDAAWRSYGGKWRSQGLTGIPRLLLDFDELFHLEVLVPRVARFLRAELPVEDAARIASELSVDRVREIAGSLDQADPETELRPGHVTRGEPDVIARKPR